MRTQMKVLTIARYFAEEVTVHSYAWLFAAWLVIAVFCFQELTASATHEEAEETKKNKYDGYYSSTKTCEMAMSEAVKREL